VSDPLDNPLFAVAGMFWAMTWMIAVGAGGWVGLAICVAFHVVILGPMFLLGWLYDKFGWRGKLPPPAWSVPPICPLCNYGSGSHAPYCPESSRHDPRPMTPTYVLRLEPDRTRRLVHRLPESLHAEGSTDWQRVLAGPLKFLDGDADN
jgi:hypothetical protein